MTEESTITREDFVEDEHLEFLDDLRISGIVNMFGSSPYLKDEFPELDQHQAKEIVMYWMETFEDHFR